MTAAIEPSPRDAATVAVVRVGAALAVAHVVLAGLALAVDGAVRRGVLIGVELLAAVAFALVAVLGVRRVPALQRDITAIAVTLVVVTAAAVRTALTGEAWPAVLSAVALAPAVLIVARTSFVSVLATGIVAAAAGLAGAGFTADDPDVFALIGAGVGVALAAAFTTLVRALRLRTDAALADAERRLQEQAVRDPVTGVANRQGLLLVATPMIDHARRAGDAVHCIVVDVDTVRGLDEPRSPGAGDDLLVAVADSLVAATRATDVVARWDGDQFVVLGPGTGSSPLEMERRIRGFLAELDTLPKEAWQGRVSAGVATLVPWDADDLDGLLHRAAQDMALRRSLRRRAAARMQADDEPTVVPHADAGER